MGQGECPACVLNGRNHFHLIWIIAKLLIDSFLTHGRIIHACIDHRVPNEGCHPLRKHIGHKLKLFAELETTLERLLCQLRFALFNHAFGVLNLHVKVVQIERLQQGHNIRENGLCVAIVHDLLLRDNEFREDEILVLR